MKHYNIPIFISHFGCPNSCVFCNQKKINGVETDITVQDIKNIIDSHLKTLPKISNKEVAFFGGTFTGIDENLQEIYLQTVYEYIKNGEIDGIRLSTRPDYITPPILDRLVKYGVKTVELGVQSLDDNVLIITQRFYTYDTVKKACELIKKYNLRLGIQLMVGLPQATFDSDINSTRKAIKFQPNDVRIYPTLVITNTEMLEMYKRGEYQPLSIDESVKRVLKMYAMLELSDINIIRVGLQPSTDLEKHTIAGPYHSAFRELIESEIYYNFLKDFEELEIQSCEKNISRIVGLGGRNKKRLGLKIKINKNLNFDEIMVNKKIYSRKAVLEKVLNEG